MEFILKIDNMLSTPGFGITFDEAWIQNFFKNLTIFTLAIAAIITIVQMASSNDENEPKITFSCPSIREVDQNLNIV